MRAKNYVRNERGSFVETRVVGVRADEEVWKLVDEAAKKAGMTRNGFIVKLLVERLTDGKGR